MKSDKRPLADTNNAEVAMNDIFDEVAQGQGLALTAIAKILPNAYSGKPVNIATVLRWVLTGIKLPDGTRVKLQAARLGGRWVSTPGAVKRFVMAQTPNGDSPPQPRPDRQRSAAAARAARKLSKAGW